MPDGYIVAIPLLAPDERTARAGFARLAAGPFPPKLLRYELVREEGGLVEVLDVIERSDAGPE
jgi:hypothetical protein